MSLFDKINAHRGHRVEIAGYGGDMVQNFDNVAVECVECYEVIVDADREVPVEIEQEVSRYIYDATEVVDDEVHPVNES